MKVISRTQQTIFDEPDDREWNPQNDDDDHYRYGNVSVDGDGDESWSGSATREGEAEGEAAESGSQQKEEDEEEWILTKIVDRRRMRSHHGNAGDSSRVGGTPVLPLFVPLEDRDESDGFLLFHFLEYEYKVCWKRHDQHGHPEEATTWEPRSWLYDAGYGPQLVACDQAKADKKSAARKPRLSSSSPKKKKNTRTESLLGLSEYNVSVEKYKQEVREWSEKLMLLSQAPTTQDFSSVLAADPVLNRLLLTANRGPRSRAQLRRMLWDDFIQEGVVPIGFSPVPSSCETRQEFLQLLERGQVPHQLLFHGTRQGYISKICRIGLRVPGERGVRVRHGSLLGRGIYSALHWRTSFPYCDDKRCLLLCAGVCGHSKAPGVFVYPQSHLILPLLVIRLIEQSTEVYQRAFDPTVKVSGQQEGCDVPAAAAPADQATSSGNRTEHTTAPPARDTKPAAPVRSSRPHLPRPAVFHANVPVDDLLGYEALPPLAPSAPYHSC